jgi:hypothetical protein
MIFMAQTIAEQTTIWFRRQRRGDSGFVMLAGLLYSIGRRA